MVVRLKTYYREQKQREAVKSLFEMFRLPSVDYTRGYQPKPRPEPTGGSAVPVDPKVKAVNELLRLIF